jgi:protein SCO1
MPSGFGLSWPGHSTTSADQQLAKIHGTASGAQLLTAVETAVRLLATSTGAKVSDGARAGAKTSSSSNGLEVLIAIAAAAVLVILAVGLAVRRRRSDARVPNVDTRIVLGWLGWGVPAVVLIVAVAVIADHLASHGRQHVHIGKSFTENSPSVFPPRQRPALDFSLRDQDGRPVSLAAYRGHPVIVTFVDPLSRELRPVITQILNRVESALPASQRPEILAVSLNIHGDTRAILQRDFRAWHLTPQWRLVAGAPRQLATVWKRYYAVIDVLPHGDGEAAEREASRSKIAYLIDGAGYERALFGWPYGVKEIQRTLQRLGVL